MESKTSKRKMTAQERQVRVWKLRLSGMRISDIAAEVGWSYETVWNDVQSAYKQWRAENNTLALTTAEVDLARLDAIINALWPKAMEGKQSYCRTIFTALEQRARITGHYAKEKVEITTIDNNNVSDLAAKLKELVTGDNARPNDASDNNASTEKQ